MSIIVSFVIKCGRFQRPGGECRAMTRPPRPSSTAECLRLIAHLREEQAPTAS